jgi:hypothetical protein
MQGIQEATRGLARGLQTSVAALPAFDIKTFLAPLEALGAALQTLPEGTLLCSDPPVGGLEGHPQPTCGPSWVGQGLCDGAKFIAVHFPDRFPDLDPS